MKICLDISPAISHPAGIGRYVFELCNSLLQIDQQNKYIVFHNQRKNTALQAPFDKLDKISVSMHSKLWRSLVLFSQLSNHSQDKIFRDTALFHATDHLLPNITNAKSIFTLHDITYILFPGSHTFFNKLFLKAMIPTFLRKSDAIITPSEITKKDAINFYAINPDKIYVIPHGVSPNFHRIAPVIIHEITRKYHLPDRYLLYVGTIEPRKNLSLIFKALKSIKASGFKTKLVLVGKLGWYYRQVFPHILELDLEKDISILGYVPEEDLPAIYSGADVFVYPTHYEGFGLPVLEAMACSIPVVCSNIPSLREVADKAVLMINPLDPEELTEAIIYLLSNSELKTDLQEKGLERSKQFTWQNCAYKTLQVYQSVME